MYFKNREVTYDKHPSLKIKGQKNQAFQGYFDIVRRIKKDIHANADREHIVVVIDYYHGTRVQEVCENLIYALQPNQTICSEDAKIKEEILKNKLQHELSDDRVFGVLSTRTMDDFYDQDQLKIMRQKLQTYKGITIVYGVGAALVTHGDIMIYGDLSRWEIQLRYRSKELDNWGVGNFDEDILRKYKRAYFIEWRVMDRHKMAILDDIDYLIETNVKDSPKMITKHTLEIVLEQFCHQPFRLVPYFDEGIWGGNWMEEVCGLEKKENNFAWCFDGVPEENAIRAEIDGITIEVPAMNLIKRKPIELLGPKVFSRFGAEFPIRFDFLDTMSGGNLSLQVHPLSEYIQQNFGMHYTQDESYYILDAGHDACVYLGVKDGVTSNELIPALQRAQNGEELFDDKKYINCYPIKKHDHVLIPAGTIHCSGSNAMVLEISATPYIFTMKLWDWGRVGLDGLPRPINIERGAASIQYDRTSAWCKHELINHIEVLEDDDCKVERTGLHEWEFIETRRYWFDKRIEISCDESVNMLNLIEGEEISIISLDHSFEPFIVHYAETFILPASVHHYAMEPSGISIGKKVAVIKAAVRV